MGPVKDRDSVRGVGLDSSPGRPPSLSKFLSDPSEERFFDRRFERVWATWRELYEHDSPTVSGPLRATLDRQAQELTSPGSIRPGALSGMRSMNSAGYCWRLAEETTEGAEEQDADYRARWAEMMESRPPEFAFLADMTREHFLFWGASELVSRSQGKDDPLLAWAGCLRGVFTRFDFFSAALDRTSEVILRKSDMDDDSIRLSFVFGLGLRDTERWLNSHESEIATGLIVGEAIRTIDEYFADKFDTRAAAKTARDIIPSWVTWQSTKAAVVWAAGVTDQQLQDAASAQNATGVRTTAEEQARIRYDAELDRIIRDNALDGAVERVHLAAFPA